MSNQIAFEQCRSIGHAWFVTTTTRKVEIGSIGLVVRCERCSAERVDRTDIYGNLVGRNYNMPDGYKYSSEDGQAVPSRHEFRMMMFKRRGLLDQHEWEGWQDELEATKERQAIEKAQRELRGDILEHVDRTPAAEALAERVAELEAHIAALQAAEDRVDA